MGLLRTRLGDVGNMNKLVAVYAQGHTQIAPLMRRIQRTDHPIDQVVYQLHGLTEEEIAIVEGRAQNPRRLPDPWGLSRTSRGEPMIETTPFAPLIAQLDAALEESTARERQATRRGNLDAIELEQERRRNLVNARYQLEVLQELWPEMVGRQLVPRPVGAQPVPVPVGEQLEFSPKYVGDPDSIRLCLEFWSQLLPQVAKRTSLYAGVKPGTRDWIYAGTGTSGLTLRFVSRIHDAQVGLYVDRGDAQANKRSFDQLVAKRREIEAAFGGPLTWQRLDHRRACRIALNIPGGGMRDRERWPEIQERMVDAMVRLEKALKPHIQRLRG